MTRAFVLVRMLRTPSLRNLTSLFFPPNVILSCLWQLNRTGQRRGQKEREKEVHQSHGGPGLLRQRKLPRNVRKVLAQLAKTVEGGRG